MLGGGGRGSLRDWKVYIDEAFMVLAMEKLVYRVVPAKRCFNSKNENLISTALPARSCESDSFECQNVSGCVDDVCHQYKKQLRVKAARESRVE